MRSTAMRILTLALILMIASGVVATASQEPTVVRIMTQFGENTKHAGIQEICDEVSRLYPEYKFEATHLAYDNYVEKLKTEMAAGDPPSIFTGRAWEFPQFIDAGKVYDLTQTEWIATYDKVAMQEATYKDCVWAMPYDRGANGVWYDKDMFAQYGVNVPTTKSEWIAACKTFVDAGVVPFAFGGSELDPSGYTMENWIYPMLLSSESAMRANAKIMAGEISIKDVPEYKQALINAYEMFVPFIEKNDMSIPREKAYDMFIGKKRPMTIHGNFVCGVFRAANPEANIGIFPITWSENADENKLNGYFDDNLMIAADGVTDAALKWMEFASSPAGLEIWARNTGSLTSSTLAGEIEIDPIAVDILQYFNADKVYYKSDMSMFSGNFQTEWQSMCQKFFADGIDAYQNGVDSETFVTGQLEQMDLRFKALL